MLTLLIDGDAFFRIVAARAGIADISTGDVEDGLRIAGHVRPDVILLDGKVGGAIAELKERAPGARIIVLSGDAVEREQAKRYGARAAVSKMSTATIIEAIERVGGASRRRVPPPPDPSALALN